jgi:virginiamycin B lyase
MRKRGLLTLALATFALVALMLPETTQGQRGGQQVTLPDGPGKAMVEATCTKCHGLSFITNSFGFSRADWVQLFSSMVTPPKAETDAIADYLAKNFAEKPNIPKANLISGPVQVTIREWLAPTLGQRPHDPLAARDGSIWWTGQYASRLGRVDPRSGAMKEFPLDTPNSGPHGLVEDRDGNVWYTGINVHELGKVDPRTGAVTEYKVPEPGRNPHTPIFDQKGMLFFTMQNGHVGRLNPANGEFRIVKSPSDPSYPYGIQVDSKNLVWYVDFRQPKLASVNASTMEIKEYTLPRADARPRRLAITADDSIWYTDFPLGYIGRFDPKTGQFKEWLSPGGKDSRPYGIATVGDIVWYSESGVKPNTLVRFDPKTERFQTWAIPTGGHVVRNMMATREGNLVLANSGINRVAIAEVRGAGSTAD